MMCGRTGYTPITTWARSQKALAKSIGWTDGETPCAPTIHNLLKRIDVDALEKALTKWVNQVVESCPKLSSCLDAVAMVNREQVALDAGDATWRRRLTCPMQCYVKNHFPCAKDSIICISIGRVAHFVHKMKYLTSNLNSQLTRKT